LKTASGQKEYFNPRKILRLPPPVDASSRNPGLVMRFGNAEVARICQIEEVCMELKDVTFAKQA
jgi:hypothetical protein